MNDNNLYISSLFGGGMAGLFVDMILFPLDTMKTRLQSAQGFINAGGFNGIYRGIGPQFIGSIPQAALFFCTYESFKANVKPLVSSQYHSIVYMVGASMSEVVSCIVRVPIEVVKQRRQTSKATSWNIAMYAYKNEGLFKGLYRGFGSTVVREIPFSVIQLPILEYLKIAYSRNLKNGNEVNSFEVALCGSLAGGTAAAVTTPLDVVKTRIMLSNKTSKKYLRISTTFLTIYKEKGMKGLFAGFVPRVIWITLGGCIFFGVYDFSKNVCNEFLKSNQFH
ncbi:hypothetical protein FQA39_LY03644 [Lamprigera yunnana]|nr:hypothetical protein FQA39_LY03644 [Lamprigera yunnana]